MKAKNIYHRDGVPVYAPAGAEVVPTDNVTQKPHIVLDGLEFKHCSCCNSWRRLSRFHTSSFTWDGLQAICAACHLELDNTKYIPRRAVV
jgi:hypothetical protein